MHLPVVHNRYRKTAPAGAINIMRGSPYGNPWVIGVHGDRAEVCRRFREETLPTLDLTPLYNVQDLLCCCKPHACHGDDIAAEIVRRQRMPLMPKPNAPPADVVLTPPALANQIVQHFHPSGRILDPSAGNGVFFKAFPKDQKRYWCELARGRDFFDHTRKVDWIITNPPWSKLRQFLLHSYGLADNIVLLASITHFVTRARMREYRQHGFGFREFLCVKEPGKPWPHSGFMLGAAHLQRGYTGPLHITGEIN